MKEPKIILFRPMLLCLLEFFGCELKENYSLSHRYLALVAGISVGADWVSYINLSSRSLIDTPCHSFHLNLLGVTVYSSDEVSQNIS